MTEPTKAAAGIQFRPRDAGAILIVFGDDDGDGTLDVRVHTFGKIPLLESTPTEKLHLGPYNVPVARALSVASNVVGVLPPPAGAVAGVALGAAAGGTALLQKLLLSGAPGK